MAISLYDIDESIKRFVDVLYASMDEEGTVPDEVMNELENLNAERQMKLENIVLYIKELEAESEAIKKEEKALADRRKSKENKAEWLRRYVSGSMQAQGESSFETSRCRLSFRKSEVVEADEDKLPDCYMTIDVTRKPNKAEIKKALKAGQVIEGARLVVNQNLQIK